MKGISIHGMHVTEEGKLMGHKHYSHDQKFNFSIRLHHKTQCKILHYFRAQNGMKFFFKNIKFQVLEFENGSFRFVMVYFFLQNSSYFSVRNLLCPRSTIINDSWFLTHFQYEYPHKTFRASSQGSCMVLYDVMNGQDLPSIQKGFFSC